MGLGHDLFEKLIDLFNDVGLEKETRKDLYSELIPYFEDKDCDTLEECLDIDSAFDEEFKAFHPPEDDEDEDDYLEDE